MNPLEKVRGRPVLGAWGLFLGAVLVYTALTRFWNLDIKPLYGDEGIRQFQGLSFYRHLFQGSPDGAYRYQPFFHGPLFYYLMLPVYAVFGAGFFALRFLPALFGTLFVFTPLLFRRHVSRPAMGWAIATLAMSALFTWTARVSRVEYLYHFFCVLTVFSLFRFLEARRTRDGLLAALWYALMVCSKEESFVFTAQLAVFLLICAIQRALDRDDFPRYLEDFLIEKKWAWWGGCGIFLTIYTFLYSTFFTNPRGLVTGTITAFQHYLHKHRAGVFDNSFIYHFRILYLWEIPLLLYLALCGSLACRRRRWLTPFWALFLGLCAYFMQSAKAFLPLPRFLGPLHLFVVEDLFCAVSAFLVGAWLVLKGLREGEPLVDVFFYFWACSSFLFYGYVREKLPWLTLHAAVPWVFVGMVLFDRLHLDRLWRGHGPRTWMGVGVAVLWVALSLRMNYRQNFEFMKEGYFPFGALRVTVTQDTPRMFSSIREQARLSGRGNSLKIQVADESGHLTWIAMGYLMDDFRNIRWNNRKASFDGAYPELNRGAQGKPVDEDVVIASPEAAGEVRAAVMPGSLEKRYRILEFYHVNFRKFSWKELFLYYRRPEEFSNGGLGFMEAVVFFRSPPRANP
jgi:uncharacterized protein (TIGR03663 family)